LTPTPVQPTATPRPSPDPASDVLPRTESWGGFEFALTANPQDRWRTDVAVRELASGQEVYRITRDDLYLAMIGPVIGTHAGPGVIGIGFRIKA